MIISNMDLANAVLSAVSFLHDEESNYFAQPYQNGREHGWSLQNYITSKQVSFSENRTSDDIVVYFGTIAEFSPQGNVPNDETYERAKYFAYNKIVKASKFIIEFLEEGSI